MQYPGVENRYVIDEGTGSGRLMKMPTIYVDYECRRLDERLDCEMRT